MFADRDRLGVVLAAVSATLVVVAVVGAVVAIVTGYPMAAPSMLISSVTFGLCTATFWTASRVR